MFDTEEIKKIVSQFIQDNYLYWADDLTIAEDQSLMEGGVIDSTGILELSAFIESTFKITIQDEDFVPENLDTLKAISAYVFRKSNGGF